MTSPFFSVVIPVYNKESYLERSVNSVLTQTFSDFEVILIDDDSTDGSANIIESLSDSRIRKYRRNAPGPGGYAARNLGIAKAEGRYICFLDADDSWTEDHLQHMRLNINAYPEAQVFSCGWKYVRSTSSYLDSFSKTFSEHSSRYISVLEYFNVATSGRRPIHTSSACVSSELVKKHDFFFPSNTGATRGGDLHAWLTGIVESNGLAWSNHVGACYYLDIDGQVVKGRAASFDLYDKQLLRNTYRKLSANEKRAFSKYMNCRIRNVIAHRKREGASTRDALNHIIWMKWSLMSLYNLFLIVLPGFLFNKIR